MGVDLSRVDRSVPEELLHRANICPITEEISRESVAERVGSDDIRNAGTGDIGLQVALDVSWRDAVKVILATIDKKRFFHVGSGFEIRTYGVFRGGGEEDDTYFLALAAY